MITIMESIGREIFKAVAIATLSALGTKAVEAAFDKAQKKEASHETVDQGPRPEEKAR